MVLYEIIISGEMEIEVLKHANGHKTVLPVDPQPYLSQIDRVYMDARWGVPFNNYDIHHFIASIHIWKDILASGINDWFLIKEKSVELHIPREGWRKLVDHLPDETDLFLPFDKTLQKVKLDVIPAELGYYWGCYIYFLKPSGAQKLLEHARLRQPLDEELLCLTNREAINMYHAHTDSFDYVENQSPSFLARRNIIADKIFNHKAWNSRNRQTVRKLLAVVSDLAVKFNFDLVLHGGTLLGAIRHNEIMAWDDDIDLGMNYDDVGKMIAAVSSDPRLAYTKWIGFARNNYSVYYKIWFKEEGDIIKDYPYRFPFLDIWLFYVEENDMQYKEWPRFSQELFFPLRKMEFEGTTYSIPANPLGFLDFLFKDWRDAIVVYPYCHRLEAKSFRPMKLAISVAPDTGRLITENTKKAGSPA